jgi:hypothetical protein
MAAPFGLRKTKKTPTKGPKAARGSFFFFRVRGLSPKACSRGIETEDQPSKEGGNGSLCVCFDGDLSSEGDADDGEKGREKAEAEKV